MVATATALASARATAGGDTKTVVTTTAIVIAAMRAMTKTTTQIGERRGGRESNLRINGWLAKFWHQTGVSHLLSYLRSHKKRNAQVSISAGTQNFEKMSDMRVDSSLQTKMGKSANQQARIPHFGKAGKLGCSA